MVIFFFGNLLLCCNFFCIWCCNIESHSLYSTPELKGFYGLLVRDLLLLSCFSGNVFYGAFYRWEGKSYCHVFGWKFKHFNILFFNFNIIEFLLSFQESIFIIIHRKWKDESCILNATDSSRMWEWICFNYIYACEVDLRYEIIITFNVIFSFNHIFFLNLIISHYLKSWNIFYNQRFLWTIIYYQILFSCYLRDMWCL